MSQVDREALVEQLIVGYEEILGRLADAHAAEVVEIDISMAQAKLLYLLRAGGDRPMLELVPLLGVSPPTVSGLVDRAVARGLATRRENPADRRQVIVGLTAAGAALIDRFRELNTRQMRELLDVMDDADVAQVQAFLGVLERALDRLPTVTTQKDTP